MVLESDRSEGVLTLYVRVCVYVSVCRSSRSLILFDKHFSERLKKTEKVLAFTDWT